MLLGLAKAVSPTLCLWTVQRNQSAQGFYKLRGFDVLKQTDGSANEEHEPDVLYWWRKQADVHIPG